MGKGNAAVKQWLGNPRRFADLFNGIVFQGKQVILPEDLHPATGETDILVSDKNEKAKEVQRYRDIIMRWEQGAYLVLLACENQENVHYAMTVRNMLYDSLSYVEQIRQSWKCLEAAEKLAAEGIDAKVINIHTIKPLDEELIVAAAKETGKVVTVEEHSVIGGLGSAVCDVLCEQAPTKVLKIGINDTFGESGPAVELVKKYGLDADSIYEKVKAFL